MSREPQAPDDLLAMLAAVDALERELCCRSFREFAVGAWPVVEPARPLLPSVAFEGMCAAAQELGDRGGRLAVSCPPGVSKSILWSVIFPAWLLLRSGGASRVMCGSYQWDFATRDARRCRDLVTSAWYRGLVGGAWAIREDADRRDDYWTTAGGRRLVTSVSGKAIGERVDVQVLDDVLSSADVHSAAARKEAIRWVTEVLPSRLDDPERATRVLVGQRLHPEDPISVAVDQGWLHLVLPALATDEPCELRRPDGSLIWRDDRPPGAPLFSLLGVDALARLKVELGGSAFAAQYQQRPTDDESATIRRGWWRFHREPHVSSSAPRPAGCSDAPAVEAPEAFDRVVIAVDLTFGSTTGDFAVAQVWGAVGAARYLLRQWRRRAGSLESQAAIKALAADFPGAKVLVERAANGAAVIEELIAAGVPGVVGVRPLGNKAQRLGLVSATIESGCALLPLGADWLDEFVEELAGATKHDDAADCAAYAIHELNTGADYQQQSTEYSFPRLIHGSGGRLTPITRARARDDYDFDL